MELKAKQIDGKKFMWDGNNYENEAEAKMKYRILKDAVSHWLFRHRNFRERFVHFY